MKLVERPGLAARIRSAVAEHALTIVVAPLGAGKSSALALAFDDRASYVRLDVAPWHRGAVVAALVETVRERRDEFGRLTLGALASGASPEHVGRTFARELGHIGTELILAIDNAHVLYGDPDFGTCVRAMLEALPTTVRLLLVGRTAPPFDLVETFLQRRAIVIGAEWFRFDARAIAALARDVGHVLEPAESAALEEATDGWAAGIVLALVTPRVAGRSLATLDAAIEYLQSALVPTLDAALLGFVEETSVFEILDLDALERSSAFGDARAMLESLERTGALVSRLPHGERFRINPVLRELARRRLDRRASAPAAHARAADVFVRANAPGAALYHVVASGDVTLAATFLREHAVAAITTGDLARVRSAIDRLVASGRAPDVAAFAEGLVEKARGTTAARACFVRAAAAAHDSGDRRIAFFARAQIAEYDLGRRRRIDRAELDAIEAEAPHHGGFARATAAVLAGWGDAISFDFAAARDRVAPLAVLTDADSRFATDVLLAYAHTGLGECDAAQATLEGLVRLLENGDRVVLQTLALVWFARLGIAWGSTTAALDAASQAERLATALAIHADEAALFGVLCELATHRGDAAATIRYAERARERSRDAWYVTDVARIAAFAEIATARAAFLGHDDAIARSIASRAAELPAISAATRALALTEAAVYTLLSEPTHAPRALATARETVREAVPGDVADAIAIATAADLLAFLAAANDEPRGELYGAGPFAALLDARRGLVTLEMIGLAVGNARRGHGSAEAIAIGFERYTRNGPRFEARLARAYAARFVTGPKRAAPSPPAFELTAREREILGLLVDGLTNKEIAQRIVVSPRTVETHVERVLAKLEVGSRSRAIAKALRLGLIELPVAVSP